MKFYIGSGMKNSRLVQYYAGILKKNGWQQTYDWTVHVNQEVSARDICGYAEAEKQGIADSDAVILLLPAGRGSHVELGMALAWNKRIFLCTSSREDFSIENTVAFYELPQIVRLIGTADENLKRIMEGLVGKPVITCTVVLGKTGGIKLNSVNNRSHFEWNEDEKNNFDHEFIPNFFLYD